jgi:hypothetical protein
MWLKLTFETDSSIGPSVWAENGQFRFLRYRHLKSHRRSLIPTNPSFKGWDSSAPLCIILSEMPYFVRAVPSSSGNPERFAAAVAGTETPLNQESGQFQPTTNRDITLMTLRAL